MGHPLFVQSLRKSRSFAALRMTTWETEKSDAVWHPRLPLDSSRGLRAQNDDAFFISKLQNVARQVLILDDGRHHLADVFRVDDSDLFAAVGSFAFDDGQRRGSSVVVGAGGDVDDIALILGGFGEVGGEEADLV